MKLTVFAETTEQIVSLGHAVNAAGLSIIKGLTYEDASRCESMEPSSDAFIFVCDEVDRRTTNVLRTVSEQCSAPILVLSDDAREESIDAAVRAGASSYVIACNDLSRLVYLLRVATVRHTQTRQLHAELDAARAALKQRKLIDRAKGIIMQQRSMNEANAYRAIRKLAMDNNRKMHDVAEQIITAAEILV